MALEATATPRPSFSWLLNLVDTWQDPSQGGQVHSKRPRTTQTQKKMQTHTHTSNGIEIKAVKVQVLEESTYIRTVTALCE
jgi:hypothetical protein